MSHCERSAIADISYFGRIFGNFRYNLEFAVPFNAISFLPKYRSNKKA